MDKNLLTNKTNMKLRIMQIILFFPCCLLDGLTLFLLLIPMWVVCGVKVTTKEPLLEWLFDKTTKNKKDANF